MWMWLWGVSGWGKTGTCCVTQKPQTPQCLLSTLISLDSSLVTRRVRIELDPPLSLSSPHPSLAVRPASNWIGSFHSFGSNQTHPQPAFSLFVHISHHLPREFFASLQRWNILSLSHPASTFAHSSPSIMDVDPRQYESLVCLSFSSYYAFIFLFLFFNLLIPLFFFPFFHSSISYLLFDLIISLSRPSSLFLFFFINKSSSNSHFCLLLLHKVSGFKRLHVLDCIFLFLAIRVLPVDYTYLYYHCQSVILFALACF